MIIDYILTTGTTTVSGSQPYIFVTNKDSLALSNGVSVSDDSRTGFNDFLISLNSQTIINTSGTKYQTQFEDIYTTVGDAYFKETNNEFLYFSNELEIPEGFNRNALFDVRPDQIMAIGTGQSTGMMIGSLITGIRSNMPLYSGNLTQLDFFLNGQKIYTGDSYTINSLTGISLLDNITGKLFCVPKKQTSISITGEVYDLYNRRFIERQTNLYAGGMEQMPSLWLEINTGVKTIATGLQCALFNDTEVETSILL